MRGLALDSRIRLRQNLVTNPACVGTAGWGVYGSSGTRSLTPLDTGGVDGGPCLQFECANIVSDNGVQWYPAVEIGDVVTLSAWLRNPGASDLTVRMRNYGAYQFVLPAGGSWARYSWTFTVGAAFVRPVEFFQGGSASGTVLFDDVMLTEGPEVDYFDGDSPSARWTGTPGASSSLCLVGPDGKPIGS